MSSYTSLVVLLQLLFGIPSVAWTRRASGPLPRCDEVLVAPRPASTYFSTSGQASSSTFETNLEVIDANRGTTRILHTMVVRVSSGQLSTRLNLIDANCAPYRRSQVHD